MRRLVGALFLIAACLGAAEAQQQVLVPTRPLGDNSNAAASTAFVQQNATTSALPSGNIFVGNAINLAVARVLLGDCTITNAGSITCTSTASVPFAASATTDTTNATNISSGTLGAARLPAFGSGDVSCAAAGGACTIAANAVTNTKIAAAAVTGPKIAAATVANSNLQTAPQNTVKGAASSSAEADLAVPSCSTASAALTWTTNTGFGCNGVVSGALNTVAFFSSSQTITIPANATKAYVQMWGATGGTGGVSNGSSGGTGAGGYLEKLLTGLTPGNTIVYTQGTGGTAGAATPTNGGDATATTLASGTQTISTLTCNGSTGSGAVSGSANLGTAGGTATGGDFNMTGQAGLTGPGIPADAVASAFAAPGGVTFYSQGAFGVLSGLTLAGNAGNPGGLKITWYN